MIYYHFRFDFDLTFENSNPLHEGASRRTLVETPTRALRRSDYAALKRLTKRDAFVGRIIADDA
jgi:hypothetical protein